VESELGSCTTGASKGKLSPPDFLDFSRQLINLLASDREKRARRTRRLIIRPHPPFHAALHFGQPYFCLVFSCPCSVGVTCRQSPSSFTFPLFSSLLDIRHIPASLRLLDLPCHTQYTQTRHPRRCVPLSLPRSGPYHPYTTDSREDEVALLLRSGWIASHSSC
jgi:hypothetical protein